MIAFLTQPLPLWIALVVGVAGALSGAVLAWIACVRWAWEVIEESVLGRNEPC